MFRDLRENRKKEEKAILYEEGRLYFTRALERKIFFGLTLLMLLWGILTRFGFFS